VKNGDVITAFTHYYCLNMSRFVDETFCLSTR
jgi:hypothetical protein